MFDREGPDLATSAVLHLGTLGAVLVYFRADVLQVLRFTETGRRLLVLLLIGTIPAVTGALVFRDQLDAINDDPHAVAIAMVVTGIVLILTVLLPQGSRSIENISNGGAFIIGITQALALIPGVSRSGATITGGLMRGLGRDAAARFAFLLGIPVIAGGGLLSFIDLADEGGTVGVDLLVGVAVAGLVGYLAIAILLRVLRAAGLWPFGIYCVAFGAIAWLLV